VGSTARTRGIPELSVRQHREGGKRGSRRTLAPLIRDRVDACPYVQILYLQLHSTQNRRYPVIQPPRAVLTKESSRTPR
jgi:hypothetical protein